MGCDIHSHVEKRNERGRWSRLPTTAFNDRNYALFGWLAGVRNYSAVTPIAADRGVPTDASRWVLKDYEGWGADCHSASWVGMDELLAVDYDGIVEDRRVTRQIAPHVWHGGMTCAEGEGKRETLRDFLGPEYFAALRRLREAGAERVIFWFDN